MDFVAIAKGLAVISFGLIGVMMVLGPFFPNEVEKYKKQLINVILGLILVGLATTFIGFF